MARRFNELEVLGETTVRRVVKVGKVERWLVIDTSIQDNDSKMGELIIAAHDLIDKSGGEFDGVEIWSIETK
jgi:hypothetical protein